MFKSTSDDIGTQMNEPSADLAHKNTYKNTHLYLQALYRRAVSTLLLLPKQDPDGVIGPRCEQTDKQFLFYRPNNVSLAERSEALSHTLRD